MSRQRRHSRTAGWCLATVLALGLGQPAAAAPPVEQHRGVAWVGGREVVTAADLEQLRTVHVNWIAQTPFGWQQGLASTEIRMATSGRAWWGERDAGLAATARLARAAGVRTLLKPHLWLAGAAPGQWIGDIAMASDADWAKWFASYSTFLLHYAELAEREGIEALAVGTELRVSATTREADWRRLIADVRKVFRGQLTYAANWFEEYHGVRFWDALDFVGIQGYFPVADSAGAGIAELERGWQRHLPALESFAQRVGKPIVFTEIGYKSTVDTAVEPWAWPERGRRRHQDPERADRQAQADAYEAFFRAVWDRPWFAGAYFWKWYPQVRASDPADIDFTPQGKPAADVLARWYGGRGRVPQAGIDRER
jgi:glycosyl hydrolase family 113